MFELANTHLPPFREEAKSAYFVAFSSTVYLPSPNFSGDQLGEYAFKVAQGEDARRPRRTCNGLRFEAVSDGDACSSRFEVQLVHLNLSKAHVRLFHCYSYEFGHGLRRLQSQSFGLRQESPAFLASHAAACYSKDNVGRVTADPHHLLAHQRESVSAEHDDLLSEILYFPYFISEPDRVQCAD